MNSFKVDGRTPAPINHHLLKYYSAFKDNEFLGSFMKIEFNDNEIEIHAMLKKSSIKYSRDLGSLIIENCFNDEKVQRITANIYESLKKARNYVEKLGFQLEGTKRDCVYKNGKLENVCIYGLTRKERIAI